MNIQDQWILAGRKVNNYIEDATDNDATNAKFDSTTVQEWEVPANKRWVFLYGYYKRDAAETALVTIHNSADDIIGSLDYQGAGTAGIGFPNTTAGTATYNGDNVIVLDAGEYIKITFGGAQGAGAYASCAVLEFDM